jgi:hypothetical protein
MSEGPVPDSVSHRPQAAVDPQLREVTSQREQHDGVFVPDSEITGRAMFAHRLSGIHPAEMPACVQMVLNVEPLIVV